MNTISPQAEAGHVYERPAVRTHERTSLSVLAAFVSPRARVLDLGTGAGGLGAHLVADKACTVDGLTLNAAEASVAGGAYRRLVVGNLEAPDWVAAFDPQGYDVIVCADVLEHLREPAEVLRQCQALLAPGGMLLVSVPNVAYAGMVAELMHGGWTYGPEGLLDASHLRFFTRRSFEALLHNEGWHLHTAEPIEQPWFETEFSRRWDHLPPAVADYLLAQPDASVYQWVFVAGRMAAQVAPATHLPPRSDVSVASYVMQLFVDRGHGYADATKMQVLGRMGVTAQTLRFELPAQPEPVRRLRLDPADRAGFWLLRDMRVRDEDGRVLWHWSAGPGTEQALLPHVLHQLELGRFDASRGGVPLRLTGDDPQLQVPVPDGIWATCAGRSAVFELRCDWPWSADYHAAVNASLEVPAAPVWAPFEPAQRQAAVGWRRWFGGHEAPTASTSPAVSAGAYDPVVDIVVPVYGNRDLVERCLTSVCGAANATRWQLTVIDDSSPDAETSAWLREWARAHPQATVLSNARNAGFVRTVNMGMSLAGRRDVVLLNSDTEVAGDWLDRLRAAAYRQERVGSVTPFSNNATICSLPRFCEDNPLPAGHNTASVHDLVSRLAADQTVEIPTAVGFCMYIRRACLDDVGLFDADTFGLGYGEENDFCMRATAQGWRHLHALDAFVFHQGGASFSERRHALQQHALKALLRLHPDYEERVRTFVAQDPARPVREQLARALGSAGNAA